jgi:lipopolysaccharide biosynthesis protein
MISRLGDIAYRVMRVFFRLLPLNRHQRDRLRHVFLSRFTAIRLHRPKGRIEINQSLPAWNAEGRALGYRERIETPIPQTLTAKLVAFYLPQFHQITENDEWWGDGFTEWTNVKRAQPQFYGHVQPHLPGDLGFYNLRNTNIMRQQAQLASEYGIGAFCFYFYWFAGKTLLEEPLTQWRHDDSIKLPYCLCWANESWTRTWDGRGDAILIAQQHSPEDDLAFIAHTANYLKDPRYLQVNGKPLLLVYRPSLLPDPRATALRWRDWCRSNGIGEIHIANVQSFDNAPPNDYGFDAAVEFPPNLTNARNITAEQTLINSNYNGEMLNWHDVVQAYSSTQAPSYQKFPAVNCGWDNEPRRNGRGRSYLHSSPNAYQKWLSHTIQHRLHSKTESERLIFINAWNEWAEGAVLEPDARLGYAWLHATRQALINPIQMSDNKSVAVIIHAWHENILTTILEKLRCNPFSHRLIVTTTPDKSEVIRKSLFDAGISNAEIYEFENRGRDILPFLRVAYLLREQGVEIILKLHTKQSLHRTDGAAWLAELLTHLIPEGKTPALIKTLISDKTIGMVAPDGHLQPLSYFWGANQSRVLNVAQRAGLPASSPGRDEFVSGSMFWCRMSALSPILDMHLGENEFESESGQVDGTLSHALERLFSLSAISSGMKVMPASSLYREGSVRSNKPYPFARRDF